ncbi:MAG: 5'/3'-nucleotidase SurE [Nitrospirae bacterium]|nr:MAG: 5'/3'-nucleotidase SurE [Nitrospirota bacterium]
MSEKGKVTILITNDDGIHARGLRAIIAVAREWADVWVVAPERPQNAVGRALTLHKPLRLTEIRKQIYAVNGTPADCVTLGIEKLLQGETVTMVISGINDGLNIGDDVTNSGTVSGAIEAVLHGVPAIAVSQEGQENASYRRAAAIFTSRIAQRVLAEGLPEETMLNVNVPARSLRKISGVKVTSLGRRRYLNPVVERIDPQGRKYYWIAGERLTWQRQKWSDFEAVSQGMVSITPLHVDLTDYRLIKALEPWESMLIDLKPAEARRQSQKKSESAL